MGKYEGLEWRIIRAKLALDTGWSFEYIDNLSLIDLGDIVSYQSGIAELEERARG